MTDKTNKEDGKSEVVAQANVREAADIGAAKATNMEASGAFIESGAKAAVDVSHPAVDNNPRAGTTVAQNRIDFNDPSQSDREAVEERMSNQG